MGQKKQFWIFVAQFGVGNRKAERVKEKAKRQKEPKMAAEWYYVKETQQKGPVTRDSVIELATSGQILPTDLLWNEELPDWIPAGELDWPFLKQTKVSRVPPPLPRPNEDTPIQPVPVEVQEATAFDSDAHKTKFDRFPDHTSASSCQQEAGEIDQLSVPLEVRTKLKALYGRELTANEALIAEMFFGVVTGGDKVYKFPSIPEKKLSNAKNKYAFLRGDELLLGLVDETCFGSAKDGFVLTTSGIYWHEMLQSPSYIMFVDINPKAVRLDGPRIILGSKEQYLPVLYTDDESRIALHRSIKNASALSLLLMGHNDPGLYAAVQRFLKESLSHGEFGSHLVEVIQQVINLPYRKANHRSVATSQVKTKALTEQEQSQSNRNWGVYGVASAVSLLFPPAGAVIVGGHVAKGWNDKCPSCGKWWGKTKEDTSTTEEAEADRFRCKFCNHTWSDQTMIEKIAEATSGLATAAVVMDIPASTKTCSKCGKSIPYAATQCPYCGNNKTRLGNPWSGYDA
jgi:ribosomal protein L40E